MKVRALIVEDEPLARQTLRDFCGAVEWLEVVGETADGAAAVSLIDGLRPQLVFLDVQMPEISGLEVLRRARHQPAVIFTTAFDDYAVRAFELEALDYLLKPFGRERFRQTLDRVRRRLSPKEKSPDAEKQTPNVLSMTPENSSPEKSDAISRLFVRDKGRVVPLAVADIVRLEADDDYTLVCIPGKKYLVSLPLGEFARRLPPEKFLRVHRSAIVNLDCVSEIEEFDRRLLIHTNDGATVQASRAGSQLLKKLIA